MENVVCAIYKLSINKIISDKWKNPPTNNTLMKTKLQFMLVQQQKYNCSMYKNPKLYKQKYICARVIFPTKLIKTVNQIY